LPDFFDRKSPNSVVNGAKMKEAAKHVYVTFMTSSCSLNRSIAFLQTWQNGGRQSMKIR